MWHLPAGGLHENIYRSFTVGAYAAVDRDAAAHARRFDRKRRTDRACCARRDQRVRHINTNTTWSLINSPYDVCNGGVTIVPTATLTIEPGVTVQF